MKIIGGLVLFFILVVGAVVGYVIPTQFHKAIHKKYIPEYAKDMERTFKKIGFNQQQTILTAEKFAVTIDSVSELNPFENHLLIIFNTLDGKTTFKTKVRYEVSKNLDILMEFEDFNASKGTSISLQKPVLKVSTPLDKKLLDDKERINYLVFNTSIEFLLGKLFISWKDPSRPGNKLELTGDKFSIGIGGSSPSQDLLLITTKLGLESATLVQNDLVNEGKNFSYVMTLNSFNIPGILSSYKAIMDPTGKDTKTPFLFLLMQKMPQLRKTVNFPFVFANSVKAQHADGPSVIDIEASIEDPQKKDMLNIFSMKFAATTPAKLFELQAPETLTGLLTDVHGEQFYPVGTKNPLFIQGFDSTSMKEKEELTKAAHQKLTGIFTEYLNTEIDGKKRALLLLDQIVLKNLLTKTDNAYSTKGEFKQMQLSVNGILNPMDAIKSLIPQEELNLLMKENGLVSVYEGQTLPDGMTVDVVPQK